MRMSSQVGTSFVVLLYSSAHCSFAPSMTRRLAMHGAQQGVVRARIKLGTAIARRATTDTVSAIAIIGVFDIRVNDSQHLDRRQRLRVIHAYVKDANNSDSTH